MTYIGIDPGESGAIAILRDWEVSIDGEFAAYKTGIVDAWQIQYWGESRRGDRNVKAIHKEHIREKMAGIDPSDTIVTLENPPLKVHRKYRTKTGEIKSATGAASEAIMRGYYASIRTAFEWMGFSITEVTPQQWQGAMFMPIPRTIATSQLRSIGVRPYSELARPFNTGELSRLAAYLEWFKSYQKLIVPGGRFINDNMSDAALIALYGRAIQAKKRPRLWDLAHSDLAFLQKGE